MSNLVPTPKRNGASARFRRKTFRSTKAARSFRDRVEKAHCLSNPGSPSPCDPDRGQVGQCSVLCKEPQNSENDAPVCPSIRGRGQHCPEIPRTLASWFLEQTEPEPSRLGAVSAANGTRKSEEFWPVSVAAASRAGIPRIFAGRPGEPFGLFLPGVQVRPSNGVSIGHTKLRNSWPPTACPGPAKSWRHPERPGAITPEKFSPPSKSLPTRLMVANSNDPRGLGKDWKMLQKDGRGRWGSNPRPPT